MRDRILGLVVAVLLAGPALWVHPLAAQGRFGDEETRLLREAADLESSGDLDGAERALRRLLEIDPVSTGGIYALERVLGAQDELIELLPLVDSYLSRREDSGIRALKLHLLIEADSLDALVDVAERWIARSPDDETPYAEVARAYEVAFGHGRALDVLRSGRARLGEDALALAIGDHHAAAGDLDSAVGEWARAVAGPGGSNLLAVRRRIEGLDEAGPAAARRLLELLAGSTEPARRHAATRLALELGMGPEALELARNEADRLGGDARTAYLREISVTATAAGAAQVSSWAYEQLSEAEADPEGRRVMEQRRAEAALAAGDTVAALESFERAARTLSVGATERRLVEARAIRVAASAQEIERLKTYWETFRIRYPEAPELDALAATTAAALIAWGDVSGAISALEGIEGPRSAVERAYLLLGGGELEAGRNTLMQAVPGLPPSEQTEVIQMAMLLGRVSQQGGQALANAGVQEHLGRGAEAAQTLADLAFDLPPSDQPLLLAEAARIADRAGDGEGAAQIRERLVDEYPSAPGVGEAALALARHKARSEGNVQEAIRILEDLITGQPNAAVVPEARLELERLRS